VTIDQLGYGSICVNNNYVCEVAHTNFVCDYEVQASYKGHKQALLVLDTCTICTVPCLRLFNNCVPDLSIIIIWCIHVFSATPYPNLPLPS